jgi:hypothetical protein
MDLDHGKLPDPVNENIDSIFKRQKELENQIEILNKKLKDD